MSRNRESANAEDVKSSSGEPPAPSLGAGRSSLGVVNPREPISHELKVWPEYGHALALGVKTFEFRRDDRTPRFEVGDQLHLREWTEYAGYMGRSWRLCVTYIARGGVIPEGYCVMAIAPLAPDPRDAEIAQLKVDRAELIQAADYNANIGNQLDEARRNAESECARLRAEVERWQNAFRRLGQHEDDCSYYDLDRLKDRCSCGYSDLALEIAAATPPAGAKDA